MINDNCCLCYWSKKRQYHQDKAVTESLSWVFVSPKMDSQALLMYRCGVLNNLYFCFCLGREKWTRDRQWHCFLVLLLMGTLMLVIYNSYPQLYLPLILWRTTKYNNTQVTGVSISIGLHVKSFWNEKDHIQLIDPHCRVTSSKHFHT